VLARKERIKKRGRARQIFTEEVADNLNIMGI
jgi:hypothetical protein